MGRKRAWIGWMVGLAAAAATLSACSRDAPTIPARERLVAAPTNDQAAPRRGHKAPDFALPDTRHRSIRLSQYRGKAVLVNFWATWCGPCEMEMPSLQALYERNRKKDFVVLAVSSDDEGTEVVTPFETKYRLSFPILLDSDLEVNDLYQIRTIPVSYLIDRKGYIRDIILGSKDWSDEDAQELVDLLLTL